MAWFDDFTSGSGKPSQFSENALEARYQSQEDKYRVTVERMLNSASPSLVMGLDINQMSGTALKILASPLAQEEFATMEQFFTLAKPDYTILATKMYRGVIESANLNSVSGVRTFLNHISFTNEAVSQALIQKKGKNHGWSAVKYGHSSFRGISGDWKQ